MKKLPTLSASIQLPIAAPSFFLNRATNKLLKKQFLSTGIYTRLQSLQRQGIERPPS